MKAEVERLVERANKLLLKNFSKDSKDIYFERAVFISWYCSRADCKFCYMSTQKNKIKQLKNPKLARRTEESILAEVLLCKKLNWKIEFLSGGCESYSIEELEKLIKNIYKIYKEKLWLNVGVLNEKKLGRLKPYLEGVCGAVECINPKLHDILCPSKPLEEILTMFKICDKLKLKKSMTLIIGLGESIEDFELLKDFIKKNKIDKITLYALNPHKGTIFKKGPSTNYYLEWLAKIRIEFPKLEIVAGSWTNRVNEIHFISRIANNITKLPAVKIFDTKLAGKIEKEIKLAKRIFKSRLSKLPKINWEKEIEKLDLNPILKIKIRNRLYSYLHKIKRMNKKT